MKISADKIKEDISVVKERYKKYKKLKTDILEEIKNSPTNKIKKFHRDLLDQINDQLGEDIKTLIKHAKKKRERKQKKEAQNAQTSAQSTEVPVQPAAQPAETPAQPAAQPADTPAQPAAQPVEVPADAIPMDLVQDTQSGLRLRSVVISDINKLIKSGKTDESFHKKMKKLAYELQVIDAVAPITHP